MSLDNIIFGKSKLQNVVSVEPGDGSLEIFFEKDNEVWSEFIENKYWLLAHKRLDKDFVPLKGQNHYKYGRKFDLREEFLKYRSIYRKYNVYSIYDGKEASMVKQGITYYKGMSPKDVSILSFDIETTGLKHNKDSKILIIANTFRYKDEIVRKMFCYDEYEDEGAMLTAWVRWVNEINPSILCGHNIFSFDIPYIQYIADRANISLNLGRDGSNLRFNEYKSKFRIDGSRDQEYNNVHCYGREIVDTYFSLIKWDTGKQLESYSLKPSVKQLGLEKEDRQFYDAAKIKDNYRNKKEWDKIKKYAERDGDDALALYDHVITPFFYMSNSISKSFQSVMLSATGGQINNILVRSYLQEGYGLPRADEEMEYQGGLSDGTPGIYKNVFKVDVASLYPSCVLQYEIYDKNKDPNANFLHMMNYFTNERLNNKRLFNETKNEYYDDLQNAQKIFINSGYGAMGTPGLLFNSPKCASLITAKGRETLISALDLAKKNNLTVSNLDTDSISFCKQDQSFISKEERKMLVENLNSHFPEKIRFSDDGYYSRFIVLAAKNYIMLSEDGKIKLKGSSLKSATLEPALKDFIKEIIDSMLNDRDDYIAIYEKYVKEIYNIRDMKRWASKKTISERVLESERTNEEKIREAIASSDYNEGDKVYVFFDADESLKLVENFSGSYHKDKYYEKLFKATDRFSSVLNRDMFINYKLKRSKPLLDKLLKEEYNKHLETILEEAYEETVETN